MPRIRKDVWKLPASDKTLEWYGKAVNVLRSRPLTDANSWRYLAAMHGANEQLWGDAGYLSDGARFPNPRPTSPAWNQCQHQSWFFLPWHRGYLAAFEAIVRDVIAGLPGGPQDWSLPYWNYNDATNPHRLEMPPAFAEANLADGSPNGLYVERRYGDGDGVLLDNDRINLRPAMLSHRFAGVETGSTSGFGGPSTPFWHGGGTGGILEGEPHNNVHGMVGGGTRDRNGTIVLGLMSRPDTAALDPIFWLHHANIDRLWAVWLQRNPAQNANPADTNWLNGPMDIKFTMPKVNGTSFQFSPKDLLETTVPGLDYTYEDLSDPFPGQSRLLERMVAFNASPTILAAAKSITPMPQPTELVGAYTQPLKLGPAPVSASVPLDKAPHAKMLLNLADSFSATTPKPPDRVFVNVENIRGANDAASFFVYVNLPDGADPKKNLDHRARAFTLFGVAEATKTDGPHAGNGLTEVVEITEVVDRLQAGGKLDPDRIKVTLVPATDVQLQDNITVGAISVYRQGQ